MAASPVLNNDSEFRASRQALYWRMLASIFGQEDNADRLEGLVRGIVADLELPALILDPCVAVDTLLQRHPELKEEFAALEATSESAPSADEGDGADGAANESDTAVAAPEPSHVEPMSRGQLRREFAYAKLLTNVLGPNAHCNPSTTAQYDHWRKEVTRLERCLGAAPGALAGKRGVGAAGASNEGTGGGAIIGEEELRQGLTSLDADIIRRMALHEVLKNDDMAARLTPSMPLVEQLLREKSDLSGAALRNAKALIKQYVDELAEVLKLQVMKAVKGKIDRSVPPKRVFRNLDLKKTIWKNLVNYQPKDDMLHVDRLYYKHTARKTTPVRMIVVVDQSGSMVDAMVQCTILASIFASLPRVDMHLMAFDTQVLDLTPWVHDPFEVLLRTNLGGGTLIRKALMAAAEKIEQPRDTAIVLITDFFEGDSNQLLLDFIKSLKDSGVKVVPVGAVTSSGYFSVCDWFRSRLKELGMPILTGHIRKLIEELKNML